VTTLIIIIIIAGFSIIQAPKKLDGPPQACFKHNVCFNLTIARTMQEQETGLSNHTSLPYDSAMLFIFEKPEVQRMWMKDMQFPIDIFWLDSRAKVVYIEKSAQPCIPPNCLIYEPAAMAKYVIETREGFAAENIQYVGDSVELRNIPK
jgi:uncharacterized membrane protein (UPF0127 family)